MIGILREMVEADKSKARGNRYAADASISNAAPFDKRFQLEQFNTINFAKASRSFGDRRNAIKAF